MRGIKVGIVTALAGLMLSLVSLMPAQAMAQYHFYHLKVSERANMLVYPTWHCTGSGGDFVRPGEWAEVDVRSVWVPRGYSLWSFNTDAEGTRLAKARDKARCFSFAGYPGRHFTGAFAKGNAFSWQ